MKSKSWTYSIILSIGSVVSFFLPWFETSSRASYGGQSFSQSMQGSPADALIVYVQWLILSGLSALLAYKRNRWAVLPAFLNFYPMFSALGLFGKGNSIGYSAYGGSISASTHLGYGFWIFAATTILFFIATVGELFKSRKIEEEFKSSSSVKEGFVQPKIQPQNKRTLEELKQAKELLDLGAISQEEFDTIKAQVLGVTIQPQAIQKENSNLSVPQPIVEKPKQEKVYDKVTPLDNIQQANKKGSGKRLLYFSISFVIVVLFFFAFKYFTRSSEYETVLAEAPSETIQPLTNDNLTQTQQEELEALADRSYHEPLDDLSEANTSNFLTTPTGERYKIIKVQVPNHDEAMTTSEIEVIGPVEGIYFNHNVYISIQYEGDRILMSSWGGQEQKSQEEAFITTKGLLYFSGQEFDYDRFDESIADVRALTLTNTVGDVFYWYYDH